MAADAGTSLGSRITSKIDRTFGITTIINSFTTAIRYFTASNPKKNTSQISVRESRKRIRPTDNYYTPGRQSKRLRSNKVKKLPSNCLCSCHSRNYRTCEHGQIFMEEPVLAETSNGILNCDQNDENHSHVNLETNSYSETSSSFPVYHDASRGGQQSSMRLVQNNLNCNSSQYSAHQNSMGRCSDSRNDRPRVQVKAEPGSEVPNIIGNMSSPTLAQNIKVEPRINTSEQNLTERSSVKLEFPIKPEPNSSNNNSSRVNNHNKRRNENKSQRAVESSIQTNVSEVHNHFTITGQSTSESNGNSRQTCVTNSTAISQNPKASQQQSLNNLHTRTCPYINQRTSGETTSQSGQNYQHLNNQTSGNVRRNKSVICVFCDKIFKNYTELSNHCQEIHRVQLINPEDNEEIRFANENSNMTPSFDRCRKP